ncbi:MAG: mannose-1-phosphate guanylyltransferase [Deltaproteobacteria bacterium CG11_big_fil_rev_8_21_14_0_20_47_16]|nr:MAG: mannose-1-phosphate guanylyltransferase [Deltaproteobacteria bacterium CG11_big_fil_rev_8_21_14_0_20_47_16]
MTITKAMLLAAGFGTRLRPLTDSTPKPMLPMDGHPLIAYSLGLLQTAGIRDVIINLHYLGEQVSEYCGDGSQWGMRISYSEEPTILGSGGGLKKAAPFFEDKPFIAINADTLMGINLKTVIAAFNPEHAGLMVTCPVSAEDNYGLVSVADNGRLTGFGEGDVTFAGVQIVTPRLIAQLPDGESSVINDGYKPLIASGAIFDTICHTGYWNDIGTIERYEKTRIDILDGIIRLNPVHMRS